MQYAYEVMLVLQSASTEEEFNASLQQVVEWMEVDESGKVNSIDRTKLGKRRLAYEIKGQREGNYVLLDASLDPTSLPELELNLKLYEPLIRYLIIRKDG
jgi:small subunit ribosomal protein S6